MKKVFTLLVMSIFLFSFMSPVILAQAGDNVGHLDHGKIAPDSLFWGVDVAMDNLVLALTSGADAKVAKGLEIAEERLAEARAMGLEGKFKAMSKAESEHGKTMVKLELELEEINGGDPVEELRTKLEFKQKIKKHDDLVEDVKKELKIEIDIKGEITPEQQALIDEILANLDGQTGEVKIKIDNEVGKTKIEIEVETGQSGDEIEIEIEDELGVDYEEDALEEIAEVQQDLAELLACAQLTNVTLPADALAQINDLLAQAQTEFDLGNFEEAEDLADQADDLLDDDLEELCDEEDDDDSEDEEDDDEEDSEDDSDDDDNIIVLN